MGYCQSRVPPETLEKLLEKTRFSTQEIEEWYTIFDEYYKDPNDPSKPAALTKTCFVEENIATHGGDPALWEYLFSLMDTNDNNLLEFEEFAILMNVQDSSEDRLKWTFRFFDVNKDGFVDAAEMLHIFTWLFELVEVKEARASLPPDQDTPERRVKALFSKFDLQYDGKLTLEEFMKGCMDDPGIMEIMLNEELSQDW